MKYTDEELLSLVIEGNEYAKDLIYEKYKYIIDIFLHKYYHLAINLGIDKVELEQEALYAFSDALNSFKSDKNVKLSTFISLCIDRRIKKVLKRHNGEKARLLNSIYSLDYDYNNDGTTLKDLIGDEKTDPLYNLTVQEDYNELINKIKKELSSNEYEVFNYLLNDFDRETISLLTKKNNKQVDNAIQRLKNKIRDIIKE